MLFYEKDHLNVSYMSHCVSADGKSDIRKKTVEIKSPVLLVVKISVGHWPLAEVPVMVENDHAAAMMQ